MHSMLPCEMTTAAVETEAIVRCLQATEGIRQTKGRFMEHKRARALD
jgi:hypothetical protein